MTVHELKLTGAGALAGVRVLNEVTAAQRAILTDEALSFVAGLHRRFGPRIRSLLERRQERQRAIDQGQLPAFLLETQAIRAGDWRVADIPAEVSNRKVEITGPVERKMIINALNSGAKVFMADFEDSTSPTWSNLVDGQIHLMDAVRGTICLETPEKTYRLVPDPAVLMVRPRGLHLVERHLEVDGEPVAGALFDFGLFFFHNARALIDKSSRPYFYLPKLESHLEARLWNEVLLEAQAAFGLPVGTIRATVLIETLPAAFEMDEILYELKDHLLGLNCGRWDYIFSFIKKLSRHPEFVLPDRDQLTMDKAFLEAYVALLIQTCHRRGAQAMGGMAAQIPIRHDEAANQRALEKVRQDKRREAEAGHDGTWVAHPGLVALALEQFDRPVARTVSKRTITAADLLQVPVGTITEAGVRHNLVVGLLYLEAWLGGKGCVPLFNLMEDAATAEISRAQLWQWLHHRARLADGRVFDQALYRQWLQEELAALSGRLEDPSRSKRLAFAAERFDDLVSRSDFVPFLTLAAYDFLDRTW